MKRIGLYLALISVLALLSGCNGLKKMMENADDINYKVQPAPLEMHGDEVVVKISGNFPEKYFHKKVVAQITPVLVYDNGEKALTPVSVQGEKVEANNKVIKYQEGGSFSYEDKLDYIDDMRMSKLEIRITAKMKDKEMAFDPYPVAEGVIATPALVKLNPDVVKASDKFQKDIPDKELAKIHFEKNKYNLKWKELKEEDIEQLEAYMVKADTTERQNIERISIEGYASPEGPQDLNDELSGDRAGTAEGYVKKQVKKLEELKEREGYITKEMKAEDWAGFKKLVQESSLPEKDMILRVLQMNSDVNVREKEFRNMTKVFEELEEEIHPKLRRSEIYVHTMLIGHTDAEIKELVNTDIDSLKQEEEMYAATLFEDNNKKLEIYTDYTEKYPNDWRGHNNLGCVQFDLNNTEASKTAFEKAKNAKATATVFNNLGAIEIMQGNLEKAEEHLASATGVGEAMSYNMGIIKIKQAEYEEAVNYFDDACGFNAGLAALLNGDASEAIRLAECGDDKDDPMNYYLKAVAAARQGDTELLFNNLRTAITKDPSLKSKATTDMEFKTYFENATFKEIVE